jgi:hypothetical protein
MKIKTNQNRKGQVMIISVVTLSGILLAAAAIAGLLMTYQLRSANDTVNSAKALFAADAGIEAATYCYFKGCGSQSPESFVESMAFETSTGGSSPPPADICSSPNPSAEIYVCLSSGFVGTSTLQIAAYGFANFGKTTRILEANFEQ